MTDTQIAKRPRGSGSIFFNGSAVLWIKFCSRGRVFRESSHSTDRKVAERLLERRLAEVRTDTFILRGNIRVDELIADVFAEYQENERKSIVHIRTYWRLHLAPFFTRMKAVDVGTDQIRRYCNSRRVQGASNATLNRELSLLRHAFNLALQASPPKVRTVPHIPTLKENNTRTGFLRDEDYARLAAECGKVGLWLRTLLAIGYNYGWRKSELLNLRVGQVDLAARNIVLDPGSTKNGEGRTAPMTDEIFTLLQACIVGKEKQDDYVFTRPDGKPVKQFRATWNTVCTRAAVQVAGKHLLFHDLRRSGVRNLRRLHIPESVAMRISGHKTRSVFERYNIVDENDLKAAVAELDKKQKNSQAGEFGQAFGIGAQKQGSSQPALSLTILPN
jgi:integrase